MVNLKVANSLAMVGLAFSVSSVNAEGAWWQKGVDLFKTLDPATVTEAAQVTDLSEVSEAFKQALRIGSKNVVGQLGSVDGFNADPRVRIPLPAQLGAVREMLARVGMAGVVDDLEIRLNRAAEAATPKAQELFLQSISAMTFDDVKTLYEGPEDSATRYFQAKMSPALISEMEPIVEASLKEVGALKALDQVMNNYQSLPFVPNVTANLTDHVVQKGMDGIFYYIAQEEAEIRKNPLKQSTELLKKVFGKQ